MKYILKEIWRRFLKWSRKPDGSLILLALFFFCWYKIREDYHQAQMQPGSFVIYHSHRYLIDEMTINGDNDDTQKITLQLKGVANTVPADSVKMAHQTFWHQLL